MPLQIPDVNVLVYAFTDESPRHDVARDWLYQALVAGQLGLSDLVLSGVVRVMSHTRGTWAGYEPGELLERCEALRAEPSCVLVRPGEQHWRIFAELVATMRAYGNLVPDCYHAALAIENEATWVSGDEFFGRVPGLDWFNPFA